MDDKIVLAFFIELPDNDPYLKCLIRNKIEDNKKKFEIIQNINSQKNIYFFYVINVEQIDDEEIFINIISRKLGAYESKESIKINPQKIIFLYSINFKNLQCLDTKTNYKFNEFIKFIEEENIPDNDIIEFYSYTLNYLKEKKIFNSDIIINFILKVIEYDSIFNEAISFFYELDDINDNFENQKQFSQMIENLSKKQFNNELKNKVDIFILYYYNLTNEVKFDEYIKGKEELIKSKIILFKKCTEYYINYLIQNCQKEEILLILSKCKTYNILFKIIINNNKKIKFHISKIIDLSNYKFNITNEINEIINNYFNIKDFFKEKIKFKKNLFIDFVEQYKNEIKGLELLIDMIGLIDEIKKESKEESLILEKKLNVAISDIYKKECEECKYENEELIFLIKTHICSKQQLKGRITFKFHKFLNLKTITSEEIQEYNNLKIFEFYKSDPKEIDDLQNFCENKDLQELSNFILILDKNYLNKCKDIFVQKLINYIENVNEENFKN